MAKWSSDSVLDALLDKVATSTQLLVTTTQPADRAAALAASLASSTLTGGSFTKSDATPNGRRTTIAAQVNINVTADGNATHICLVDGSNLLHVTTCTTRALVTGDVVTVPAWNVSVSDPS